ncbi:carbamoyltransferase HypF [Pseudoramibacter faecis]|uniref:carbamoyltransferase HypF n=1 Tax=Pseudoramibacter faecis TaxID=3108534 RepID=UPI002E787F1E|nr:carbamoyltransferase HypF [Pseudoramibacter sp. HA2172]
MSGVVTWRLRVYGIVQGVGFRPAVSRHAARFGITGSVCNKGPYVEILAQGRIEAVSAFAAAVENEPPRRAAILKLDHQKVSDAPTYPTFDIVESEKTAGEIYISPDIAICDDCAAELADSANRRYQHPFINCTCCGPRLTILDALPYDRERTSMAAFPMCDTCAAEYHDPESRRYDAQPVCCNDCGPEVYVIGQNLKGGAAITAARRVIAGGGVVAVKGIGGFHLCCDATDQAAVMRLRQRKHRPAKPFAVMARDVAAAERECAIGKTQRIVLTGHQKPIALLPKKASGRAAAAVAPGMPTLGLMLPYAPIQLLLFNYDDCGDAVAVPDLLVMTSGNVSGAPICRDDAEAAQELGDLCDLILSNDRPIRTRADDSVMDFLDGAPYMVRRSRGYAPLPVMCSQPLTHQVLAVGGELKNTFCIGKGPLFYPSAYVGDLADVRTVAALKESIARMTALLEAAPEAVACDLHPRYESSRVAIGLGLPVAAVQHHHAHIAACLAENDAAGPVIGLAFDGTGYGPDHTIWGGEILIADCRGYERVGHVVPFNQVGGDASAREGWRIAVALLYDLTKDAGAAAACAADLGLCEAAAAKAQCAMIDRRMNTVTSTSAGRLFDGVSAMLSLCRQSTFEGEAAIALEFCAEGWRGDAPGLDDSPLILQGSGGLLLNTPALVRRVRDGIAAGRPAAELAYGFHAGLAAQAAAACGKLRESRGLATVALSGGVFQNKLLTRLTRDALEARGFTVLVHHLVPPNDGGLALGQAVIAASRLEAGALSK